MSGINRSKPVLVFLANGIQGATVTRAARRHGLRVRRLVRDPSTVNQPPDPDIETVRGDLDDPPSIRAASRGVDHAVLQIPIGPIGVMRARAITALQALTAEGAHSFVLKLASASRPAPCDEPSFVANAAIETLCRNTAIPYSVVRPTMYLDNLLKPSAVIDIVTRNVFAPPIAETQRIAWTSADDCADAAIRLLLNGVDGRDYRIAGPLSLTGDELAAKISVGLGRPVAYRAQSIDEFERDVDRAMGAGTGRRVGSKFRYFATNADDANAILAEPCGHNGPVGFEPTDVESWVRAHRDQLLGGG